MLRRKYTRIKHNIRALYQTSTIYLVSFAIVFVCITLLTTIQPAYRLSSHTITEWTSGLDSETLLYLIGQENRLYQRAIDDDYTIPKFSSIIFGMIINITPNEPRSFLGREIPGFPYFGQRFVIGGSNHIRDIQMVESSPPLEEIMEDRKAIFVEDEKYQGEEDSDTTPLTEENVVFIYNTHNRESYLPHLPNVTEPNHAYHESVNVSKVSEYFAKVLRKHGIQSLVDTTDFTNMLHKKNWKYHQSYDASREVVQEVFKAEENIAYVFDIHRDSLPKKKTTLDVDGELFGKILFIIGAENSNYEKNLSLATKLHERLQKKQPGISRGVITKKGAGVNGIYNQDLLDNSLLIEVGGYANELPEIYRSIDLLGEVFSEYYWETEKVNQ